MKYIKRLLKSKRIQGLIAAVAGATVSYGKEVIMPGLMLDYGQYITPALAILQAAGLSWATFGSIVAKGPLTPSAVKDEAQK